MRHFLNVMPDRTAIRFIMDRREGQLVVHDPITHNSYLRTLKYRERGRFFEALLPAQSLHMGLLGRGGISCLYVSGSQEPSGPLLDRFGLPTPEAILHVQADVLIDLARDQSSLEAMKKRLQVEKAASRLNIGIRMKIVRLRSRFCDELTDRKAHAS